MSTGPTPPVVVQAPESRYWPGFFLGVLAAIAVGVIGTFAISDAIETRVRAGLVKLAEKYPAMTTREALRQVEIEEAIERERVRLLIEKEKARLQKEQQ